MKVEGENVAHLTSELDEILLESWCNIAPSVSSASLCIGKFNFTNLATLV